VYITSYLSASDQTRLLYFQYFYVIDQIDAGIFSQSIVDATNPVVVIHLTNANGSITTKDRDHCLYSSSIN
jgi:hypothetical protein